MSGKPSFSAVIPLYNKSEYIARALNSALSQDYPAHEIIVIDDGSTDDGVKIVEEMCDPRIRLIKQANRGGAGAPARNTGMQVATGTWFAFLDADDCWLPNHLTELAMLAVACPLAGLLSSTSVERLEGQSLALDDRSDVPAGYRNYFIAASGHPGCVNSSSAAVRRDVAHTSGYFGNASSGPDLEYWARVALDYPVALSSRRTSIYFRGNGGNMERLAAQSKADSRAKRRALNCLADVSPSLGLLEKRATENPGLLQRIDIQCYVNARLDQAIRMQLVRENVEQLASLAALKFVSTSSRSFALSAAARMPNALLLNGERARKRLKKAVFS